MASDPRPGKSETRSDKANKPFISTGVAASPKPLFNKVLGLDNTPKKTRILAQLDTLTQRPKHLYLEVLSYETGAQSAAHRGYQIQLPAATLGAYFGVGDQHKTKVTLRFPKDTLTVHLTHFENKTHRVRLRPLRDVPRPAIVKFERAGEDTYDCTVLTGETLQHHLSEEVHAPNQKGRPPMGPRMNNQPCAKLDPRSLAAQCSSNQSADPGRHTRSPATKLSAHQATRRLPPDRDLRRHTGQ